MSSELSSSGAEPHRWLLLIHQLPPQPTYFRVKIWRRLQGLGAVAIKNSVYALPDGEETREDFQWVLREIEAGGGDASICQAQFIDGLSDAQVRGLFDAARGADYEQVMGEARELLASTTKRGAEDGDADPAAQIARLKRRLGQTAAIDFFGAPGREAAEAVIAKLEAQREPTEHAAEPSPTLDLQELRGCRWVTRRGVHVDRIACAWLIRRFIDPDARFAFVPVKGYRPQPGEIRFDMFEAEYTHQGDRCTFEVLRDGARLAEPALRHIGEIVHDIDVKDGKFDRPEAAGIDRLIAGLCLAHDDDTARIERGMAVFDDLLEYFRRKRRAAGSLRS